LGKGFLPWIAPLTILLIWELFARLGGLSPNILPAPTKVAATAVKLIENGQLLPDLAISLMRALAGFVKYWRPWPYRRGYQHSYALLVLASLLSDAWIIPLGFFGLWRFRARWREAPAFPSAVLAMTGVYGAVHAVIRYRLPLMAGMILLACAAAASLLAPAARARGQMK